MLLSLNCFCNALMHHLLFVLQLLPVFNVICCMLCYTYKTLHLTEEDSETKEVIKIYLKVGSSVLTHNGSHWHLTVSHTVK